LKINRIKKIKAIRSDRDGEYYDRYDVSARYPEPFANFLKEWYYSKVHYAGDIS